MLRKIKNNIKTILLIAVFMLLSISITKDIIRIYAVSSVQEKFYIPIIMYHQVKNSDFGKNAISPYEFESDLKYLLENEYHTITMTQLIDYVYDGTELPSNPIILTFDDGYYNTYKYVYPLLEEYDMKIVLSIVGKSIDDFSRVHDDNVNYAHMTWDQIREVAESGHVEIQNHSYNLHKICNGRYGCYKMTSETMSHYEQLLMEDLQKLQDEVYTVTNKSPNTFTYPYGKYNDTTETIIKDLGFKATLSVEYGLNLIKRDTPECLFSLRRICRAHNDGIKAVIKEGMKTLKYRKD